MMFGDTVMTLGDTVMWLLTFCMFFLMVAIFKSLWRAIDLRRHHIKHGHSWGFDRLRRSLSDALNIPI
jgi:hypothetical protein